MIDPNAILALLSEMRLRIAQLEDENERLKQEVTSGSPEQHSDD